MILPTPQRLFLLVLAFALISPAAIPQTPPSPAAAGSPDPGILLQNKPLPGGAPLLPLNPKKFKKLFLAGPGLAEPAQAGPHAPAPSLVEQIRERALAADFQITEEAWIGGSFTVIAGCAFTPDEKTPGVHGLKGEYFNNFNLESKPAGIRIDENLQKFADATAPDPLVKRDGDGFSVRWTGFIKPPVTGKYRISLSGQGRSRVWIKDQLVYDGWDKDPKKGGMGEFTNVPELRQGELYPIRIEYRNQGVLHTGISWMSFGKIDFSARKASDAVVLILGQNSIFRATPGPGKPGELAHEIEEALESAVTANPATVLVLSTGTGDATPLAKKHASAVVQERGKESRATLLDLIFGPSTAPKQP